MDERTLRVLEYPKIKQMLTERCASSLGKARAEALTPSTSLRRARAALSETSEAAALVREWGYFPFGGLSDISELLSRARTGLFLEGSALLRVADCLRAAVAVHRYLERGQDLAPTLWHMSEHLTLASELQRDIEKALDDEGKVKPDASPELIRLHRQATSLEEAMRQRLGTIMRQAAERDLLQEALIVSRDGRFCVPVKATVQSRFQGIVHDRSASGATVFMEPLEIVERGNRLRETYLAIRDEQEAVLRALTHHVGAISESVQADQQTLGLLDFISARAHLALEMDAAPPELADDGVTSLRSARHPFIADQHVVPTSIWIGDEFSTLVITGPNTGGKTVCLKTLGLLTLMAMSGLHIPAEAGSRVSVFENVWADIGDEQSIEQSLSTFSSHMTQIVKVINRIYARRQRSEESNSRPLSALVLLDEVGAGTDPTEGAALARTILSFLHQSGCRTVATTHYNSLKLFAYAQEGMQNASVQFDPRTLQPTYRLLIGSPGSSNAFEIAQRLGLPRRLVSDARASLDDEQLTAEQAISQMRSSQQRYDRQTHNLKQESRQMEQLRQEYEEKLAALESRETEAMRDGFRKAREIVQQAEEQARQIIARLQAESRQSRTTQQLRDQVSTLRREVARAAETYEKDAAPAPVEPPPQDDASASPALSPGDWVHVSSLRKDGSIIRQIDAETYEVSVQNMRAQAKLTDLTAPKDPPRPEATELARRMQARKVRSTSPEIHLRGRNVAEALLELEKYLDDASLAGLQQVRIVHGKGTGALRQGLREYLATNSQVRSFETAPQSEGGSGATVVYLR
jgi:DNA mismatch repair protein MutS2